MRASVVVSLAQLMFRKRPLADSNVSASSEPETVARRSRHTTSLLAGSAGLSYWNRRREVGACQTSGESSLSKGWISKTSARLAKTRLRLSAFPLSFATTVMKNRGSMASALGRGDSPCQSTSRARSSRYCWPPPAIFFASSLNQGTQSNISFIRSAPWTCRRKPASVARAQCGGRRA